MCDINAAVIIVREDQSKLKYCQAKKSGVFIADANMRDNVTAEISPVEAALILFKAAFK